MYEHKNQQTQGLDSPPPTPPQKKKKKKKKKKKFNSNEVSRGKNLSK